MDGDFDTLISAKVDRNNPPSPVLLAPSLHNDLEMILILTEGEAPGELPSRHTKASDAVCGHADESGRGLGGVTQRATIEEITLDLSALERFG